MSSSSLLGRWGGNFQNWDKDVRHQIIADEGKELVQIDQAGAEALIVAYECELGDFRRLFLNGIKPHIYVAMHIFHLDWCNAIGCMERYFKDTYLSSPIDALTSTPGWSALSDVIKGDDIKYYIGKKTCHSCNYGMGEKTYSVAVLKETEGRLVIPVPEATKFIGMYHMLFPEIRRWHALIESSIKNKPHILRNLFGFPRIFTQWPVSDSVLRDAISWIPQSTVGMISNIALTQIGDLNLQDVDILQNGHDSILLQCPEGKGKEIAADLRIYLQPELTSTRKEKFKMKTDVGIGKNWGPRSDENPEGMK